MKPRNFPGRKEQRRVDAEKRAEGRNNSPYTQEELERFARSLNMRTKKDRRRQYAPTR